MKWPYIVAFVALLLGTFVLAEEAETERKEPEAKWELVHEVTEVTLDGTKVTATGIVVSQGWKNARLEPFKEEADGIYRFKFQAQPPDGPVAQVLTPVGPVEYDFKTLPANLHMIVVDAAENKKELLYTRGAAKEEAQE